MCGIVGYLNLNGSELNKSKSYLPQMCKTIVHRGPDEEGMTVIGPVALGMTRLSIIDLVSGQQPIANEDESVWIVFNGEIYNFQELEKQLRDKGHVFRTKSDTETIVHLYEEYGVDCLQFLEGMFSFAIWDIPRKRLFVARDRMGEKPLHWGIFDGQFIFGSELKSLLVHPHVSRQLNVQALKKYLALEYVPAPDSIFKGIHKLMPAHCMVVENGEVHISRYWDPQISPTGIDEREAKETLVELLERSVQLRLISDVPLGIFLSGGIDSSTIAALAVKHSAERVKTFSIGFADSSFDESEHAQVVARHLGTDHQAFQFLPELALSTMQELWQTLDEPVADASILPTFFLSKMTRREVTVALSGEGGDELFGGYPTYQAHKLAQIWRAVPQVVRENILEPSIRGLPVSHNNLTIDYKLKRFISAAAEAPVPRHLRWMGSIPQEEHASLIRQDVAAEEHERSHCGNGNLNKLQGVEELIGKSNFDGRSLPDVVDTVMRLDMFTYLPDDLLVKSDRASMAASLEVRLPFLAFPLVEFAMSLPSSYKVRGWTTKYLLKKAVAPYLPRRTIDRPKKGFGIPVAKWLNHDFKAVVDEFLGESFVNKQGLFNWQYIHRLLDEHKTGRIDRRKELWTLLMFQWWWSKFFMEQRA